MGLGPIPIYPQLTPSGDVIGELAAAGLGKNRIDLRQAQPLDGVVLVDKDRQRVQRSPQGRWLIAESLLEFILLARLHRPRHRPELSRALN